MFSRLSWYAVNKNHAYVTAAVLPEASTPVRKRIGLAASNTIHSSFFWTLTLIAAVGIACRLWLGTHEDAAGTLRTFGVMAPLVALAVQTATMMTPVGSSVMPVVNGMLFPLVLAVALNLAGGLTGGVIMYRVYHRGDREIGLKQRLDALPSWARRFARTDLASLTILRMLPWAGGTVSTLLAGTCGVPLRIHILSVLLGSLPGSIIYALLGAGVAAL